MVEVVRFARDLYSPAGVQAAVDAYGELATFEVELKDDEIVVSISEPDPDIADALVDEFLNHALHETITRHRARSAEGAAG